VARIREGATRCNKTVKVFLSLKGSIERSGVSPGDPEP